MATQLSRIESDVLSIIATLKAWAANWAKLDGISAETAAGFADMASRFDKLETEVNGDVTPAPVPVSAASDFGPPIFRKGKQLMNYGLKNDTVVGPIAIVMKDDEGNALPMNPAAAWTPTLSDASVNVVMNDGSHYTINALMRRGTPTITWHEAASMVPDFTDTVNVVEDFTATSADSDLSGATVTPQPLPAA